MTLPELLIVLTIAAVLVSLSLPFMNTMVTDNRVSAISRELYSTLMLARSEAIKRQRTLSVCSTINGTSCDQSGVSWHHGWLVFTDETQDGVLNDSDRLLRWVVSPSELVTVAWNQGFSITFNSRGQTRAAGTFLICDRSDSPSFFKAIVISLAGRLRVESRMSCG